MVNYSRFKPYLGFTFLELLITLAIAAIVMAFAVPALSQFIQNDRLTTQINTLVSHLALARSQAVTRNQQVILCPSQNQTSCAGTWNGGWILFADINGDSALDADDEILRVQQALEGNNTLTTTVNGNIIYDYRGFASDSNGSFSLCDDRGVDNLRAISITNTGRVRRGGATQC
jgi:type IV fimbrial biogenesis protein FimT